MKYSIFLILISMLIFSCSKDDPDQPTPAPVIDNFPEEFSALKGIFGGEGIGAAINLTEDILILFNQEGTKYAWFEDQEIKLENFLDDSDSPFLNSQLETVGAACLTHDYRMYIYDAEGENYTFGDFDPENVNGEWNDEDFFTWSGGSGETWQWGPDNTNPFNRISMMLTLSNPGEDCFDASLIYDWILMADGNGDELTNYSVYDFAFEGSTIDTENHVVENNCGGQDEIIPFDRVGAACRYVKPNGIQEIFFNSDGTQFCFYTVSEGIFSEVYNLY